MSRVVDQETARTDSFLVQQMQGFNLTRAIISNELHGIFSTQTLRDMYGIIKDYEVYTKGADFTVDQSSNDWSPATWHAKEIKTLIDKEARFMFSVPPDIRLKDRGDNPQQQRVQPNEVLLQKVLENNKFNSKLVRAAKDYLIGKRIAIAVNFNAEAGITISFIPSLEFVYETDERNVDRMTKFIQFYTVVSNDEKTQQRIYKKKWYLDENSGKCHVSEGVYDGNAKLIEELLADTTTEFDYIPISVVINDGLVNDPFGVSEVEALQATEEWYSKLSNKDIDSLRKGTDQITWALDIDPRTTADLSRAPGAFWDLQTDPAQEGRTGSVGVLDNPMSYSTALDSTLKRLKTSMYSALDVPDTSNEALQGMVTSGKTMQAVYWGLMTRCSEKMLDWVPAFKSMVRTIIEGCKMYPEVYKLYEGEPLVDDYEIIVESNYPILQDDIEEKSSDILEVNAKVRSRKSYMKKWQGLTEQEIDEELKQIQLEASMLEQENYFAEDMGEEPEEEPEEPEEPEENPEEEDDIEKLLSQLESEL